MMAFLCKETMNAIGGRMLARVANQRVHGRKTLSYEGAHQASDACFFDTIDSGSPLSRLLSNMRRMP